MLVLCAEHIEDSQIKGGCCQWNRIPYCVERSKAHSILTRNDNQTMLASTLLGHFVGIIKIYHDTRFLDATFFAKSNKSPYFVHIHNTRTSSYNFWKPVQQLSLFHTFLSQSLLMNAGGWQRLEKCENFSTFVQIT